MGLLQNFKKSLQQPHFLFRFITAEVLEYRRQQCAGYIVPHTEDRTGQSRCRTEKLRRKCRRQTGILHTYFNGDSYRGFIIQSADPRQQIPCCNARNIMHHYCRQHQCSAAENGLSIQRYYYTYYQHNAHC